MANQSKDQDKDNNNSKDNLSEAAHTLRSSDSSKKEKVMQPLRWAVKAAKIAMAAVKKNKMMLTSNYLAYRNQLVSNFLISICFFTII